MNVAYMTYQYPVRKLIDGPKIPSENILIFGSYGHVLQNSNVFIADE
jgi:hypothetical protein